MTLRNRLKLLKNRKMQVSNMNDVINILTNYLEAIKKAQYSEILIANIRSFVQLLESSSCQPIIALLKEQKYSDLKRFQYLKLLDCKNFNKRVDLF